MKRLSVVTGRGGAGKSTFTALMTKHLPVKSLLLIDLDPDESLARMVGVDLERERKLSISELLYEIMLKGKESKGYLDTSKVLKQILEGDGLIYRDKKFDLLRLGTKFAPGCYCTPDEVVKAAIPELIKRYQMVVVDSPAGLEHLNRKITPDIDDLFIILDPSVKSVKHIERVKYIIQSVRINYKNFFLVGNYQFNEESETFLISSKEQYLGKIHSDFLVHEYNLKGEPILNIPEDSPASLSVKQILSKAGYFEI